MVKSSPNVPSRATPPVPLRGRRLLVVRGLLAHALAHHALAWVLLSIAAIAHRLPWAGLIGLVAATVTAAALLPFMARRGVPRHRFDPALFGPLTLLSAMPLAGVALLAQPGQRFWLVACVLPTVVLSCVNVRGKTWSALCSAAAGLAGGALLVAGLLQPTGQWPGDGLVLALAALMGAPLMLLGTSGRLRHLRGPAAKFWLLSDSPSQGVLILRFLIASVCALSGVVALEYGASLGLIDATAARWMSCLAVITVAAFYLVTRMGLNLNQSDRTMTEPKLLVCVVFLAFGYYVGGIGRGLALTLLVTLEMFGMFVITPSQVARISAFATVAFSVSMLAVSRTETDPGQLKLQGVTFGVMVVVLAVMSWLAHQLGQLRNSLMRRRNELAEALERIQMLATRDELTGLVNRRHMTALLNQQIKLGLRTGSPACIALIDLDHFKTINDTHGHGVGDEVLRSFSQALQAGLRDTDVVARWGGEEFLVLLNDSDLDAAASGIERARLEVSRATMSRSVPALRITFSCGLAAFEEGQPLERLVDLADQRLYEAKAQGRNRTCAVREPKREHPTPDHAPSSTEHAAPSAGSGHGQPQAAVSSS